jgi:hypothetical protein
MAKKSVLIVSLIGLVFFSLAGIVLAQTQEPVEQWVAKYQYSDGDSAACCVASDGSDNVYVTGGSCGDYATVKYDSNGIEQWARRYDGPGNRWNSASAIAVDGLGNVYVTGYSGDKIISNPDVIGPIQRVEREYATIKYDTNGNQLWVARYNGLDNSRDEPSAMAVDVSGNVYVTGYSDNGSDTDKDYATIKYDSNGFEQWVRRYDGKYDTNDYASALAVDGFGNVYVTGTSDNDGVTIKYDSNGNQLWVTIYEGGSANDIALDVSRNVYVTGTRTSQDIVEYHDWRGNISWERRSEYATIKYDIDGNQLWVAKYSGSENSINRATAVVVDWLGNAYVTGASKSLGNGYYDYATVKYDRNGNQLWAASYESGSVSDIAVDSSGNVYVTGERRGDYATVKYDTNGNYLWVAKDGSGMSDDVPNAIAVDRAGNVYITGWSQGIITRVDDYGNNIVIGYNPTVYTTIKYSQPAPPTPAPQTRQPTPSWNILVIIAIILLTIAAIVALVLILRRRPTSDRG